MLGDLLYEIRFPTMTMEEFGQKVANCEILGDTEARYLFLLFSGAKPAKTLPFKSKKRTQNFQLLKFPANSVSNYNYCATYGGDPTCTVLSSSHIPGEFEISEVQFCQPVGHETIDQVDINGVKANSVEKVQNKVLKGYPVYKASFEKAIKYSSQRYGQANITFQNKNGQNFWGSNEPTALVTAHTINHSFTVNGQQIKLALQGYDNATTWCCLTALKMRYVKPK